MSGLVKPKKYDWKDSNLALFGSDTEKGVKKASAESEPAWIPVVDVCTNTLFVWRIEKFKVVPWPKADYGHFFSGDSYIVLNVYKEAGNDQLNYDVHFWIGKHSTQDEYGTAAYKTVELDTFLDDRAIQHREVEGNESDLFKSYFSTITIMKGGCDSGFRHVTPEEYKPRLLHFASISRRQVEVTEVRLSKNSLTSNDVFILDLGSEAFQWNGNDSSKEERIKAAQYLQQLESERHGRCKTEVLDENSLTPNSQFYKHLPDVPVKPKQESSENFKKSLFCLSDSSGKMTFTLISEASAPRSMLNSSDVFIIDNGNKLFVYVGSDASHEEKMNAIVYAHNYLKDTNHPTIPVTIVGGNQKSKELEELLD